MSLQLRLGLVVFVAALVGGGLVAPAGAATANTVVSLTFDDGLATQAVVAPMLAAHAMHGTFFINSDNVDTAGHLTWGQLTDISAAGNEIAGHTLDHLDLTTIDASQVQWQVCEDRARLMKHGFAVTNFAYPYGNGWGDGTIRSIIQGCGYNSARRAWGLVSASCWWCTAYAETIPPGDPYGVMTADNPQVTTTLDTIEGYITAAENNGGGWVILVFHNICDGCSQYSQPQANLQALLDWLQPRAANGTVVETMKDVIGGSLQPSPGTADTTAPTTEIACNGGPCSSSPYAPGVQATMAASDTGGSGLDAIRYTTDGSAPALTSAVYSQPLTISTTTTLKFRAWDNAGNAEPVNTQSITIDGTPPTGSISYPSGYVTTGSISVTFSAADGQSGVNASSGQLLRASAALANGACGTFGSYSPLAAAGVSSPFVDSAVATNTCYAYEYVVSDNVGNQATIASARVAAVDSTPPTNTLSLASSSNAFLSSGTLYYNSALSGGFTIVDAVSDAGSGPASARFPALVTGGWTHSAETVTTGTGAAPTVSYTSSAYSWTASATTPADQAVTAADAAGNSGGSGGTVHFVSDTTAPAVTAACSGSPCNAWYNAAVAVSLQGSDGQSGVSQIRYTTDGSVPTLTTGTRYTAPFNVGANTTVTYRAWDNVGNASQAATRTLSFETLPPAVAITSPTNGSSVTGQVTVSVNATDTGGSGVASVAFYVDGALQSTQRGSGPTFSFKWNSKPFKRGQHTLTVVAVDNAGNTTTSSAVTVSVR
jgi:peptidoglycan/xylan/chitin deacetylase (PgdA/CDA1 family)